VVLAVGLVVFVAAAVRGAVAEVLAEPAKAADGNDRIVVAVTRISDRLCGALRMANPESGEQGGYAD
jgi:hypothetical protein